MVSRCRYLKELLIFYGRKNSRYPNNWRKSKEVSEEISKWNAQFLQKTRHFTSHTPRHRFYQNEIKCKNVMSLRFNGKIYLNVSKIKILNKVEKTSLRKRLFVSILSEQLILQKLGEFFELTFSKRILSFYVFQMVLKWWEMAAVHCDVLMTYVHINNRFSLFTVLYTTT